MNAKSTPVSKTFEQTFLGLAFTLLILFILLASFLYSQTSPISVPGLLGLFAFVALAVVSEVFPLRLPYGNAGIGLSGTINWSMILIFEPFWIGIAAFTGFIISGSLGKTFSISKNIFNGAQVGLSATLASLIFLSVQNSSGIHNTPIFYIAFITAIVGYWLLNTSFVSIGAWVLYGNNPFRFWRQNFQWYWIYELTSAPIALAVAVAYNQLALVGLALLILPVLMIRLAYGQYLNLKQNYHETVRVLIKVIEMHDPYTAGHSDRVAIYSRRLSEALGISPSKTELIELAAYLHDLGKIHLDLTGIVRKAGRLTDEERRMVRLHPVMSADLSSQVTFFQGEIRDMILHHHENWDGSGYPHGLKGERIPLGSRIILLADAFDAMTTSRVYREALDIQFVKEEFEKFAGIQFDPELVPIFLDKVIGDGSDIIKPPLDEPLEGLRARSAEIGSSGWAVSAIP